MFKYISIEEQDNGLAIMTMNDPNNLNIFTKDFVEEFIQQWDNLIKNIRPKALILRGREDVFCGGGDKDTLIKLTSGKVTVDDLIISDIMIQAPFPIIAAVEGHAMGGGLCMIGCSDVVILATESRYGAVFMNMGFTPGMGSTTLLPLLFGHYVASEMMFTGKRFKGKELTQMNTNVNHIVPKKEIMALALDIADRMTEKPHESLYLLKHSLNSVKKKLLIDARLQEDLMHKISFNLPETKKIIEEFYAG